ncbi:MAG: MFS transporter [Chloroflexota bacterium]
MQKRNSRVFYGWWIVLAAFVLMAFNSMAVLYGMSVFYKRLIDHFGWTRTQLAAAIALSRLEAGLLGGIEGFLVDKLGPRPVMLVGVVLVSLGFIVLSMINSLFQFYLVFIGMVVMGQSLSTMIPVDTTVANWFIRRRGTAFGLMRASVAVGAAGVVLVAWLVAQCGWRTAFVASGIGFFAVGIPAALVMRRRPEYYGLLPDGDTRETRGNPETGVAEESARPLSPGTATVAEDEEDIGMPVLKALKSWPFWAISLAYAIRMGTTAAITLHAIPLVEDMGYSRVTAAAVLGSMGTVSIIGRLGGGVLNDIIGTKRVAVGCVLSLAVSFLILAQAQNLWHIWLFVAIYAPSYGCSAATLPAIKGDYFGRRSFGTILGLSGILQTGGSMFGPVFAGYVYDVTKSYRIAFFIFAGLLLIAAALFMTLGRPRYSREK